LYNAELQIIILLLLWRKITDKVQNQPRQWATCKDVHFGQFGEHSGCPQWSGIDKVGTVALASWSWQFGNMDLAQLNLAK
jgi:hypothetical protein